MTTTLVLTPARLARCARVAEHPAVRSLIAHLVVLSSLFPQSLHGSRVSNELLARVCDEFARRSQRLYVRLPQNVCANDLEDERLRRTLVELATMLVLPGESGGERESDALSPLLVGEVGSDRIDALLYALESSPVGSAVPWIFAAELLGTGIAYRGSPNDAVACYRRLLLDVLTNLAEQSPQIFWRRLVTGTEPVLLEALRAMLDAAKGASALAVGAP